MEVIVELFPSLSECNHVNNLIGVFIAKVLAYKLNNKQNIMPLSVIVKGKERTADKICFQLGK